MKRNLVDNLLGNSFIHPAFDYLVIGGGLSLMLTLWLWVDRTSAEISINPALLILPLFMNGAHFAASTVRLYAKKDFFNDYPFLTLGFPLVSLLFLTVSIALSKFIGSHVLAFYLTWSPFHYAAQAYGLACIYSHRSQCKIGEKERKLLWWSAMLPFVGAFIIGMNFGTGLGWLVSYQELASVPLLKKYLMWLAYTFFVLGFVLPIGHLIHSQFTKERPIPLICTLMFFANGVWWLFLAYLDAFVWATIFHGLQYLAIVLIYHVREKLNEPENRHGWLFHSAKFYGICLLGAYALFNCWPYGYKWLGFNYAESLLMIIAIINIHHFIVDGFIWRLRKKKVASLKPRSGIAVEATT